MKCFCEFENRTNMHHFGISLEKECKDIVLYDDHRVLLAILFEIQKNHLISGIPDLVYFDYHDDCVVKYQPSIDNRLQKLGVQYAPDADSRQFWGYMEFELNPMDDDWLTAATDFNMIGNAFCIGLVKDNNLQEFNERYKDLDESHRLFKAAHLNEASARDLLGKVNEPFVLDFDLDCFTHDIDGTTKAWDEEIFIERYVENKDSCEALKHLIEEASLITICREPECCGGIDQSNKILSYMDKHFFGNALKT